MPPRRRPRFLPFIVTGAVLGFLVGVYLASRPDGVSDRVAGSYDASAAVGYLGFLCAGIAAVLAALVALLVERVGRR
ncbi:hypothetical protein [Oryzobacter telluris]|uniref:hypothetical protein n=1 Tax=Oryzobacter telluris TaxID=3149179 RepID=UPI00370D0CBC